MKKIQLYFILVYMCIIVSSISLIYCGQNDNQEEFKSNIASTDVAQGFFIPEEFMDELHHYRIIYLLFFPLILFMEFVLIMFFATNEKMLKIMGLSFKTSCVVFILFIALDLVINTAYWLSQQFSTVINYGAL